MSLIFIDGFDHYPDDVYKYDSSTPNISVRAGEGRFGGGAMVFYGTAGGDTIQKDLPSPVDEVVIGFAYYTDNTDYNNPFLAIEDSSSTRNCLLYRSTSGAIVFYYGNNITTPIATSDDGVIIGSTWQYIEVKYLPHESAGRIEVRVDEAPVLIFEGKTAIGLNDVGSISPGANITGIFNAKIDDLYILDTTGDTNNDFLGDVRVITQYPFDDGIYKDFKVLGAATAAGAVDDPATEIDEDATFIENGSNGARHSFTGAASGIVGTVYGVQINNCCRKTDTSTRTISNTLALDGLEDIYAPRAVGAEYKVYHSITDYKPGTTTPWDMDAAFSSEFGIKVVS